MVYFSQCRGQPESVQNPVNGASWSSAMLVHVISTQQGWRTAHHHRHHHHHQSTDPKSQNSNQAKGSLQPQSESTLISLSSQPKNKMLHTPCSLCFPTQLLLFLCKWAEFASVHSVQNKITSIVDLQNGRVK